VLCCAVLCCAVLCRAVLCCAVLAFAVFISFLKRSNIDELAMSKHVAVSSGVAIIHTNRYTVIVSF